MPLPSKQCSCRQIVLLSTPQWSWGLNATGTPSRNALADKTKLLSTLRLSTTHGWDSLQDCSCRQNSAHAEKHSSSRENVPGTASTIARVDKTWLLSINHGWNSLQDCPYRRNYAPVANANLQTWDLHTWRHGDLQTWDVQT